MPTNNGESERTKHTDLPSQFTSSSWQGFTIYTSGMDQQGRKTELYCQKDHPTLKTFSVRSLSGSETWFCISPHPRQLLHSSQWGLIQDNKHRYLCSLLSKITRALITISSAGISAFRLAIWFCETWRKTIFCNLCSFTPILLELTKEFNREGQQDHNRTFFLSKADRKFAWCVCKQPNYLSWTSYHPSGGPTVIDAMWSSHLSQKQSETVLLAQSHCFWPWSDSFCQMPPINKVKCFLCIHEHKIVNLLRFIKWSAPHLKKPR